MRGVRFSAKGRTGYWELSVLSLGNVKRHGGVVKVRKAKGLRYIKGDEQNDRYRGK